MNVIHIYFFFILSLLRHLEENVVRQETRQWSFSIVTRAGAHFIAKRRDDGRAARLVSFFAFTLWLVWLSLSISVEMSFYQWAFDSSRCGLAVMFSNAIYKWRRQSMTNLHHISHKRMQPHLSIAAVNAHLPSLSARRSSGARKMAGFFYRPLWWRFFLHSLFTAPITNFSQGDEKKNYYTCQGRGLGRTWESNRVAATLSPSCVTTKPKKKTTTSPTTANTR